MNIKYNGRIIPNGQPHNILTTGANCQVFAYYLLRYHNLVVPDFRSSELWTDTTFSEVVMTNYQPLDILFFHKKNNAYGAHLAVYLGNNQAIHNAKKNGVPVIYYVRGDKPAASGAYDQVGFQGVVREQAIKQHKLVLAPAAFRPDANERVLARQGLR